MASSSSSSSTRLCKYDVFLSFRGEDTRVNFTDHLYKALVRKGIFTFRDDNEMEEGTDISSELLAAIEVSRVAVVVVSKHYASSRWCLAELVKIFECKQQIGMKIMPIFYNVDPSDVRNQRGSFEKAFVKHVQSYGEHSLNVLQWRKALFEIANLKAWVSNDRSHESEIIEDISEAILRRIKFTLTVIEKDQLVGISSKLNQLSSLLNPNLDDNVISVGIHGMGGIGKTTIARVCYEQIREEFEVHCFLSNVREQFETSKITHIQSKLLSRITFSKKNIDIWDEEEGIVLINKAIFQKKTLLVLDDVDDFGQISKLTPKNEGCFGYGSRIIITTRNAELLWTMGVKRMFKMEELKYKEALQLLSLNAFKERCSKEGYLGHSNTIVKLVGGHPLALKTLGSSLQNKDLNVWNNVIERLQGGWSIDDKIFKCLKVSYDGLDDEEKEIFLDVACFFKGKRRDVVEEILDGCDFYAKRNVELLIQKSLLTLSYDSRLQMHDLLQEMGRKIVRQKPVPDRLWGLKDINKSVGVEASIQSIFFKSTRNVVPIPILFSRMHQLRLLNLRNVKLKNQSEYCIPTELRYLKWKRYPLEILELDSELEYNLIELHMCYSNLKQLWDGEKYLEKLKYINVSHSQKLFKTPNFTQLPNLLRLDLEGCTTLINIHPSIFIAKQLTFLSLKDCINFSNLPGHITIEALEVLILSGCLKLNKIPEFNGNTEILQQLYLDGTSITELPSSFASLNCLKVLSLKNCKMLVSVTSATNWLPSLKSLNLSGCSKLGNPTSATTIEWLISRLFKAPMSGVVGISSFAGLYSLTELILSDCNIEAVPEGIECLLYLSELDLSDNSFCELPASIARLHNLRGLYINGCKKLMQLPELPDMIVKLDMTGCISLKTFPNILTMDHLYFMRKINLVNCYQFADNIQIQSLLTSWMQKMFFHKEKFSIMIPGSEIPGWFTTTKMGSSITVKWDPNAPNAHKICFALCIVCGPTNRQNATIPSMGIFASMIVKTPNDSDSKDRDVCGHGILVSGMNTLDHIWMFVLPWATIMWSKINKCTEIEFRFLLKVNQCRSIPLNMELKKCGLRLINMEEEKENVVQKKMNIFLKSVLNLWARSLLTETEIKELAVLSNKLDNVILNEELAKWTRPLENNGGFSTKSLLNSMVRSPLLFRKPNHSFTLICGGEMSLKKLKFSSEN